MRPAALCGDAQVSWGLRVPRAFRSIHGRCRRTALEAPYRTDAEGLRLTAIDAQEAMACTIAETMGWENLPTAIRMAESLAIDTGTRRRFAEALARTGYPFAPGG